MTLRRLLPVALPGTLVAVLFLSGCKARPSEAEPVRPQQVAPAKMAPSKLILPSKKEFNQGA